MTTTTTNSFELVLNPGSVPCDVPGRTSAQVFVKVKWAAGDKGRLSITGVVGPLRSGRCLYSAGQCADSLAKITSYNEGWDETRVRRLQTIWTAWHLNDMNSGCVHQRVNWDTSKRIEVVSYGLNSEAYQRRKKLLKDVATAVALGEEVELSDTDRALVLLEDWFKDRFELPTEGPLVGCFTEKKREIKHACHVRPEEHPEGLLCKPCEECGYKWGSAWLHEEVPGDVLAELQAFPRNLSHRPAWV